MRARQRESGQELKRGGVSLFQRVIRQSLSKSLIHKPCNEGQIVGLADSEALLQRVQAGLLKRCSEFMAFHKTIENA